GWRHRHRRSLHPSRSGPPEAAVVPEGDCAQGHLTYRCRGTAGPFVGFFVGSARRGGLRTVVPWMLLKGTVAANVGRLWARTWVAASYPEASLIRVGSLNAVPMKLIPSGTPKTSP